MKHRTSVQTELTPAKHEERCVRTGKKCFRTPALADKSARTIRQRGDVRMHSYRCDSCRQWHLGHGKDQ